MVQSIAELWQRFQAPIILGALSLFCIILSLALFVKSASLVSSIEFFSAASPSAQFELIIDIEGAVARPGVYTLPIGSRVQDAIEAAGGFSSAADSDKIASSINRAAKLADGAKLFIPRIGDAISQGTQPVGEVVGAG